MCNLEQTTFMCGHMHLILLDSCDNTFRRNSTPDTSPPDFCRSGTHIVQHIIAQVACKADCRRKEAQDTIERRYALAKERQDELSARVQKVSMRLTSTKTDDFLAAKRGLFAGLAKEGWDAEKLAALCDTTLNVLRDLLHEFAVTKAHEDEELAAALAAAKASVKEVHAAMPDGTKVELVAFDVRELEKLCDADGGPLYGCVCEIERRASEACLEFAGWEVPKEDQAQCEVLSELGAWKKGSLRGSGMDDAWVGKTVKIMYTE
ncbi:hypothetical protein BU23DRAFT_252516 [Bimuria novae-zelandiae CBS 107.79]|uniref:Uncharacterized protein n=1 Tax=Bimuria novae-zelandiae CBS 107.79 TaxID=1447943 RepID=A0A6A5VR49_9PLEO|nr:hypothetical protein BU23DRAFT_252516 [Bimuria novae-zelandiae CBS 107.79]